MKRAWVAVLAVACGGTTSTNLDGGSDATTDVGTNDTGTQSDAGPSDAGLSPACPATAPDGGAPCSTNVSCEYGSSNDPLCNMLYDCNGHTWSVLYSGGACGWNGTNAPSCPSTYAAATGACSGSNVCEYPQGRCECVVSCGGPPPPEDAGSHWVCSATTPGCPVPRGDAKIGATCTMPGQQCSYGACCSGANQECSDAGIWTGDILAGGCP